MGLNLENVFAEGGHIVVIVTSATRAVSRGAGGTSGRTLREWRVRPIKPSSRYFCSYCVQIHKEMVLLTSSKKNSTS